MDKPSRSRKQRQFSHAGPFLAAVLCFLPLAPAMSGVALPHADALRIGKRIWQNECNGTIAGLTSWNEGENFASLGIGHFIWYPKGQRGPFEESFPNFIAYAHDQQAPLPVWIQHLGPGTTGHISCPWNSRTEFERAKDSPEMKQLRQFLAGTVDLQAEFLVKRLESALPKMLEEAPAEARANVQRQFERVAGTSQGCYALVDYVNFKGEGVLHTERYRDQGWGLLQVLAGMNSTGAGALDEFARSAATVLKRRVQNSPPERKESRWLSGWLNRVNSYSRG
ncbi:MAG: hypothetical protein QOE73_2185 [Verrucomicrobiota bacterium]